MSTSSTQNNKQDTTFASSPNNNNNNNDNNNQRMLDSIRVDLEAVERGLDRPSSSSATFMGRAAFDSISSALGSIRSRIQQQGRRQQEQQQEQQQQQASITTTTTATTTQQQQLLRSALSERLDMAEMAHSMRIPLHRLAEELASRRGTTASDAAAFSNRISGVSEHSTAAAAAASVVTTKTEQESQQQQQQQEPSQAQSSSTTTRRRLRRVSSLLASRRMAEAATGIDVSHHASARTGLTAAAIEASTATEAVRQQQQQQEKEEGMEEEDVVVGMEIDDDEEEEEEEQKQQEEARMDLTPIAEEEGQQQLQEEHHDIPILMTQESHSKLDSSRRSILFDSSSSLLPHSEETKKEEQEEAVFSNPTVYSWGHDLTHSLHNHNQRHIAAVAGQAVVSPTDRVGRTDAVQSVSTSHHISVVATASGEVLICGDNDKGAVDPSRRDETTRIERPVLLELLSTSRVVQVSCGGDHAAALLANGSVLTWGSNEMGQLGHRPSAAGDKTSTNNTHCRPRSMALGAGRRAAAVACGDDFTLVLTTRMCVLACGNEEVAGYRNRRDDNDGDGDGDEGGKSVAVLLQSPPALQDLPLVSVAAGGRHAVVLTAHGTAYAWGANAHGCCGREYPKSLSVPVPIRLSSTVVTTTTTSGTGGAGGPFPNWTVQNRHVALDPTVAVTHAACGDEHTVLVTRSGRLWVCGSNAFGQLGLKKKSDTKKSVTAAEPVDHPTAGRRFVAAEAGEAHTLLLDDVGHVWQMGGGGEEEEEEEASWGVKRVLLDESRPIKTIAAGGRHNIAISVVASDNKPTPQVVFAESLESLLEAITKEDAMSDDNATFLGSAAMELARRTEHLFMTPPVLNSLFLNPTELEDLYDKLMAAGPPKVQQAVATALEKGMHAALDGIDSSDARLMYPESVRFLLLYLQCPLFRKEDGDENDDIVFDRRGDLILSLCETILELPFEGYRALLAWATSLYRGKLFAKLLVRPLLVQLNRGLSVTVGAVRRVVPVVAGVLRGLYNASELAGGIVLPEEFYCEALGELEEEELVKDLLRWKNSDKHQRATNFFLCDNSFLFSPRAKRKLLTLENEVEMVAAATSGITFNAGEGVFTIEPYFVLEIEREHLLSQTLEKISEADPSKLRKKLRVVFKGEEGIDAGGVTREFFQLLSVQLFDIASGMWSSKHEQITWFNSDCTWNEKRFTLVGMLVGLAVYNGVLLDVNFPTAVYRKLLGMPLGLEDMVDEETKSGLQQLLNYEGDDVEDVFCLTFALSWMDFGNERQIELKPGGADIAVTSGNKEEYVMLYVKWLLVDSIQPQYDAFEKGFERIMESSTLELLSPEELELLVVGTPELDFDALESHTEYEGGYDGESDVIKNFWHFVKSVPTETQLNLLKFATGSSKAPIGGLGELNFKIQRAGPDSMQLPTSHTCFNTLLLPDYGADYEKLAERLGRAILECEGFGLQ